MQTYQDSELIILDNASTDNSREVIQAYTSDPRVRTIYNFWHNIIPNASAVLLRRKSLDRVGGAPNDMIICGDWMT